MRAAVRPSPSLLLCVLVPLACAESNGPTGEGGDAWMPDPVVDANMGSDTADAAQAADAADAAPPDAVDASAPTTDGATDAADAAATSTDAADSAPSDGAPGDGATCTGETLSTAASAAYFPFTAGAHWMFRSTGTSNGIPIGPKVAGRQVTGTKSFGGAAASIVLGPEQDLNPKTIEDYFEVTTAGLVDHGSSEPGSIYQRAGRFAAPYTAIPFPLAACPYRAFDVSVKTDDLDNDGLPETVAAHATTTLSFEDVTVPIGTFTHALRVDSTENLVVTYTKHPGSGLPLQRHTVDWYASGVGPIKRFVEHDGVKTTGELIGYAVGGDGRGVVPVGPIAQNIDEAGNNPYKPNRPAVGYDGKQFLVVVPTTKEGGLGAGYGNLKAIVVDRAGKAVSSNFLLDSGDAFQGVSIAWDGTRYLVAYRNAGYQRVELLTVSSAGQTIDGPVVLDQVPAIPSVVATKDGFLVSYQKYTAEPGTQRQLVNLWLAAVDGHAHPTSRLQPFTTSQQWSATLAQDGNGGVLALFNTPPATPSPTSPETADILAAARLTSDGHAIDPTPFSVEATPKAGHENTQLVFDGTNYLAQWSQRIDSSTEQMHVARISATGALLDGSGGIVVGGGANPRLARFGTGALVVWGHRLPSDYFSQGIGGTRLGSDGHPLDVPGDGGGRWFFADDAGDSSLTEIVWAGDRALVVWANPASDKDVFDVGCALAYPW